MNIILTGSLKYTITPHKLNVPQICIELSVKHLLSGEKNTFLCYITTVEFFLRKSVVAQKFEFRILPTSELY